LLEEDLGAALFRRLNRSLELTDVGQRLADDVQVGFTRLRSGVDKLRKAERLGELTVSAAPSLAAKWLVPRIERFNERHPDIQVRLIATGKPADFDTDGVDMALRFGPGGNSGCDNDLLFAADVFPVCSPVLVKRQPPLRDPSDLRDHMLLHDANSEVVPGLPDWRSWLLAAGVERVDTARGPRFNNTHLVLDAAIAGTGVALAVEAFAAADLAAGRLVRPFDLSLRAPLAYWIVAPATSRNCPKVQAFRRWLLEEAGQGPTSK
jgi:LysR family glycine cleavage system transcriptional activator